MVSSWVYLLSEHVVPVCQHRLGIVIQSLLKLLCVGSNDCCNLAQCNNSMHISTANRHQPMLRSHQCVLSQVTYLLLFVASALRMKGFSSDAGMGCFTLLASSPCMPGHGSTCYCPNEGVKLCLSAVKAEMLHCCSCFWIRPPSLRVYTCEAPVGALELAQLLHLNLHSCCT